METKAYIRATGMYVPEKVVTNNDFPEAMETNDEWIQQRSGIRERRFISPGQTTSDLAKAAVEDLMAKSDVTPEEVDCIIVATVMSDYFFPGAGMFLQDKLGWSDLQMPCYDIRQQCAGFIYGLQMAQAFVENGLYRNILLVGTEIHSSFLEFNKRGRAVSVLFGDGAGAAVISAQSEGADAPARSGINSEVLHTEVHADGSGALNGIYMKLYDIDKNPIIQYDPKNPEENAALHPVMSGSRNLFSNAVRRMNEVSRSVLGKAGLTVSDIDWVVPHQANMRINNAVAEYLDIDANKVLYNIQRYANTTAATIPLLLAESVANGTIKRGDLLLMPAFGAGFVWGASLVRF